MIPENDNFNSGYGEKYLRSNYFKYKPYLYKPFIKALVNKVSLSKNCCVLDAGCGQGFFTHLLAELGFNAVGVDLSADGIAAAKRDYEGKGATFEVGDILALQYREHFDGVFVRGCSLYNSIEFEKNHEPTQVLLTYIKPGGCLIFNYHTNFCPRKHSETWIYHSLASIKKHFSCYSSVKVYFSLKIETLVLGKWAFAAPITTLNANISRSMGIGGDAIAIIWKK